MLTRARAPSAGAPRPSWGAGGPPLLRLYHLAGQSKARMATATTSSSLELTLRAPRKRDAFGVARLLDQFGYPTRPVDVAQRLDRMIANSETYARIGTSDREVTAVGAVHFIDIIEGDRPLAVLILLIVDEHHRGRGMGTALVQALEEEAKARRSFGISVHSGQQRVGAHEFYRHLGYELTGERMLKIFTTAE
jgi:GNAT superfamily N-acetyltransferase